MYLGIDLIRRDTIRKRGPFMRTHTYLCTYEYVWAYIHIRRPRLGIYGSRIDRDRSFAERRHCEESPPALWGGNVDEIRRTRQQSRRARLIFNQVREGPGNTGRKLTPAHALALKHRHRFAGKTQRNYVSRKRFKFQPFLHRASLLPVY
jgi:hypothetical protein